LGALLRREGLYASNLNTWRHQRERGILSALTVNLCIYWRVLSRLQHGR